MGPRRITPYMGIGVGQGERGVSETTPYVDRARQVVPARTPYMTYVGGERKQSQKPRSKGTGASQESQ